ncbi:MAG: GntR family transcriptional regulator [Clostridiales bacterium]|nr:GntR family transcriptional regulator [Clostridiales bacterium]
MIQLNYRDPRPIYEQIKSELKRLILTQALAPGEKLPSVRELAAQLAINPNTIQRAYRELDAEGYTVSIAGRGSFVADIAVISRQKRQQETDRFLQAAQSMRKLGFTTQELIAFLQKEEEPHD